MKKTFAFVLLASLAVSVAAQSVYVPGYVKKDGTYVAPHHRSAPDDSRTNNYSSHGNSNPYTGKEGTVDPYSQPSYKAPSQSSNGQPCHYSSSGRYVCN